MEIKLELVLAVGIIGIMTAALMLRLDNASTPDSLFTKELEFTNTTFIEVDTVKRQGISYSTYGIRDKEGILTLDNLQYHTDTIALLVAKKGRYEGEMLYLDGDIVMHQKEGFDYLAEHALYNQKTEILDILSPFTAVMNQNIIRGETLHYDTRRKEAFAQNIDAIVYTSEK